MMPRKDLNGKLFKNAAAANILYFLTGMLAYQERKKKVNKLQEVSLNSLPSESSLGLPIFTHCEVPLDRNCSW